MTGPAKSTPPKSHPCVVATEFAREQVDPRIATTWASFGFRPKFGDLRKIWRTRHCKTLNPYSSEHCAYDPSDCAMAYLVCAQRAAQMSRTNPVGYFWKAAHSMAVVRADEKPLARTQGSGHPGAATTGARSGSASVGAAGREAAGGVDDGGMRRVISVPHHIGSVLGSLDLGPHQRRAADGREGTE